MSPAKFLFNLAAGFSTLALAIVIGLWITACHLDPRTQFVSLTNDFHISLYGRRSLDARLYFFNRASEGPYTGSIIGMVSDKHPASRPIWPQVSGFGDTAGLYYRMIRFEDGTNWWTLSISFAYPLVAFALLPLIWILRRVHKERRGFPVDTAPKQVN